jgi:hypothetical protein
MTGLLRYDSHSLLLHLLRRGVLHGLIRRLLRLSVLSLRLRRRLRRSVLHASLDEHTGIDVNPLGSQVFYRMHGHLNRVRHRDVEGLSLDHDERHEGALKQ